MNPIVEQAIARRASQGLALTFQIPDRAEPFTCYPKDEAQKMKWLEEGKAKGWTQA